MSFKSPLAHRIGKFVFICRQGESFEQYTQRHEEKEARIERERQLKAERFKKLGVMYENNHADIDFLQKRATALLPQHRNGFLGGYRDAALAVEKEQFDRICVLKDKGIDVEFAIPRTLDYQDLLVITSESATGQVIHPQPYRSQSKNDIFMMYCQKVC